MSKTFRSRIGPYSKQGVIAKLNQRSPEAGLMREVRKKLTAHIGGKPSQTEQMLIDRAAWLTLHLALMDERALKDEETLNGHGARIYLAWTNTLVRTLKQIGLKGVEAKATSLAELLRQDRAA